MSFPITPPVLPSRSGAVQHGAALTFETLVASGDEAAAARLRRHEDTLLRVIAGSVSVTVERLLCAGEEAIIPAGASHRLASRCGEARLVTGFRTAARR
jgi:hypothetical protein